MTWETKKIIKEKGCQHHFDVKEEIEEWLLSMGITEEVSQRGWNLWCDSRARYCRELENDAKRRGIYYPPDSYYNK
jgi:hypothetical protein